MAHYLKKSKRMKGIFLFISILLAGNIYAQQREKIAVVDLEYILKKVPEYQEQNQELRKRAREWDIEIQKKKKEIKRQKDQLALERPLLTSQIIEEKEEEIALLEKELLDYQQQHFGLDGDYFIQKINLAKPDRKSTRLNSSHVKISYAVFCLKTKKYRSADVPVY